MSNQEVASDRAFKPLQQMLTRRDLMKMGLIGGAVVSIPGLLEACVSSPATGSRVAPIIKLGFGDSKLGEINPFTKSSYGGYLVSKVIWPTLVFYDYKGDQYVPGLAQSWTTSADGLTWTFKLQPNAGWSDGKPVTAQDVIFTMNMAKGLGGINNISYFMLDFTSWTALDEHTVQIKLQDFNSSFLEDLLYIYVLPQHIWQPFSKDMSAISGATHAAPLVGSGPFSVSKIDDDSAAVLTVNPHFYGTAPKTQSVGAQVFGSEQQALLALENAQVDLIPEVTGALKVSSLPTSVQFVAPPGLRTVVLWVNVSKKQRNPWMLNPKVRQALSLAIDRGQVVQSGHNGLAIPESTLVATSSKWHNSSIQPDPFDLNQANTILEGLGFQKGADGTRVANGKRMSLTLLVNSDLVHSPDPEIIQQGWKQLGVDVTLKPLDNTGAENLFQTQDSDIYLSHWWGSPSGTLSLNGLISSMSNRATGYSSAAYDEAYSRVLTARTDADRKAAMTDLQKILVQDRPLIPIVTLEFATVSRKGVNGLIPTAEGSPDPLDIAAWLSMAVAAG